MKDGTGAPYVKFFFQGKEIQERVESFKYKHSEEDDECCEVNIRRDDRNAPDLPEFQEGAQWSVLWGYIGGNQSRVHKIYLQELKWDFDDQNILLTASFTERAQSLKQRSTSKVYVKTSILEILHDMAKVHGLTPYVEIPGQFTKPKQNPYTGSHPADTKDIDTNNKSWQPKQITIKKEPLKIEITDSVVAIMKSYAEKQVAQKELDTSLFGADSADIRQAQSPASGAQVPIPSQSNQREDIRNLLTSFNTYANIPQANRSDKQLLNELVRRQPDGPFFIDSHDDVVILKRRHFDKPSHRSFYWADTKGELLAFQPESKNRSKKGTSVAVTYQGYDKLGKTFFKTSTDANNESAQNTLAKTQEIPTDLNGFKIFKETPNPSNNSSSLAANLELWNAIAFDPSNSRGLLNRGQFDTRHDATNVVKVFPAYINTLTGKDVLHDDLQRMPAPLTNNVVVTDPTATNPSDALTNAGNNRRGGELKNNPGYIEIIGDPTIEKGQIITILGVSKKYSGNYYIKTVTHDVDGYKSYITRCDIVRQGVNIKTKTGVTASETGKTVNTTVGEPDGVLSGDMKTYLPRQSTLKQDKTRVIKVLPILNPK